jgi:RNA polymerase sigma-70 factor (ECF subfamily)
MVRTGRGDRDAFAELVRRYQSPLLNFFPRMGARTDEAEDLVQETFLRVFRYRERYRPSGKFTNFLYVLARHAWADMARKGAREPKTNSETLEALPAPRATDGPDSRPQVAHPGGADSRLDVQQALDALSEKLRVVLVLRVYQGLKQDEIAETLGIPVGTVKSRMHLAFRRMKELLDV